MQILDDYCAVCRCMDAMVGDAMVGDVWYIILLNNGKILRWQSCLFVVFIHIHCIYRVIHKNVTANSQGKYFYD